MTIDCASLMFSNVNKYLWNSPSSPFADQWNDEDSSEKKKKGLLIVAYFTIVVLFPVALGILEHNLEVF